MTRFRWISTALLSTLLAVASAAGQYGPDLEVRGAGFVQLVGVPGETAELVVAVGNAGREPAEGVLVEACAAKDWCARGEVGSLKASEEAQVRLALQVDRERLWGNPYFFTVVVDPDGRTEDSNRDNNALTLSKPLIVVEPTLGRSRIEDEHDDFIEIRDGRAVAAFTRNYGPDGAESERRELPARDKGGPVEGTQYPEPTESGVEPQPRIDPRVREADEKAREGERLRYLVRYAHDVPMPRLPALVDTDERFSKRNVQVLERRLALFEGTRRARLEAMRPLGGYLKEGGIRVIEHFALAGAVLVDAPKGALKILEQSEQVLYVEPEIGGEKPPQDGNPNNDAADGRARIVSDPYFNGGATGAGFIALLDTGIRPTHTLFNSPDHIFFIEDCVAGDANCNNVGGGYDGTDDCWNHGTKTAGIITGNGNLGNAFRGITSGWLDSWKVYPSGCGFLSNTAVLRAYDQAVAWGDQVIVAEMQSGQSETGSIATAADDAYDAGSLTIAANGNNGPGAGTVNSPANAHKALGIGNYVVDTLAAVAGQSRGPTTDNRYKPDIQAPTLTETASAANNTALATFSGTSGATPYGAGAASVFSDWYNQTGLTSANAGKIYAGLINAGPNGWGGFNNTRGTGRFDLPTNGHVWWGSRNVSHHDNDYVSFNVPADADEIRVALWWPEGTAIHNDIDLFLLRPDGTQAHHSISTPSVFEHLVLNDPTPPAGTWRIRIYGYNVFPFFSVPFFSVNQTVYYAIFVRN